MGIGHGYLIRFIFCYTMDSSCMPHSLHLSCSIRVRVASWVFFLCEWETKELVHFGVYSFGIMFRRSKLSSSCVVVWVEFMYLSDVCVSNDC